MQLFLCILVQTSPDLVSVEQLWQARFSRHFVRLHVASASSETWRSAPLTSLQSNPPIQEQDFFSFSSLLRSNQSFHPLFLKAVFTATLGRTSYESRATRSSRQHRFLAPHGVWYLWSPPLTCIMSCCLKLGCVCK